MNRRDFLKLLGLGSVAIPAAVIAKPEPLPDLPKPEAKPAKVTFGDIKFGVEATHGTMVSKSSVWRFRAPFTSDLQDDIIVDLSEAK